MFGTLRFLLALLVVGCHTDWEFNPTEVTAGGALDLGSVSVIIFFILSGYVMTASVRRYYAQRKQYIGFIFDRVCRIFPQYILWLLLTLLWIQLNSPGAKPIGTRPILENLVLLPLMFSVWDCQPLLTRVYYIGQAWSLSLELFFYLLLPVLLWSDRLRKTAFLLSLLVFALATFNVINPNVYSYHLVAWGAFHLPVRRNDL